MNVCMCGICDCMCDIVAACVYKYLYMLHVLGMFVRMYTCVVRICTYSRTYL